MFISQSISEDLNTPKFSFWRNIDSSSIAKYYPRSHKLGDYAIYLLSLDRFLVVESFDLFTTLHAVKLLSSKMSVLLCILPPDNHLTNENCLEWGLHGIDSIRLAEIEKQRTLHLESKDEIAYYGLPSFSDLTIFKEHQNYAQFVLRATYAIRLTDMIQNSSDHSFFMRFFANAEKNNFIKYRIDDMKWPNGFIHNMDRILYLSASVEEALHKITKILPASLVSANKFSYAGLFYDLLGRIPSHE